MLQQDVVLQGPVGSSLVLDVIGGREHNQQVNVALRVSGHMFMNANYGRFFDPLLNAVKIGQWFWLLDAAAKLGEPSDHKVTNLLVVWIARDEEHVSGDSLLQHLLASDVIVAEREEDPCNVGLDHLVVLLAAAVAEGIE